MMFLHMINKFNSIQIYVYVVATVVLFIGVSLGISRDMALGNLYKSSDLYPSNVICDHVYDPIEVDMSLGYHYQA